MEDEKWKRLGQPVQLYAPFTYDAVYIIVDAMKRVNSTDRKAILSVMQSTDFRGVIGETTFDHNGDLKHGVISLYRYTDGKKTFLDAVPM